MDSTLTEPETSLAEQRSPGRINGWFRWLLRIAITLHALDAFTQAVLAGRFLSGDYGMLQTHLANANFGVSSISTVQIITAILYWRPGGGRGWPVLASLALTGIEAVQIALGVNRVIGIHVPLGVLIILISAALSVWAWRPAFDRRRRRRSAA
jgi:hypothetical protein